MSSWERLPDEPVKWYVRFETYRLLGPNRTLLGAYNTEQDNEGRKRTPNPATSWRDAFVKYNWQARAEAWDLSEQTRITAEREAYLRNLSSEFDAKYRYIHEEALKAWLRSLEDAVTETSEMVEVPEVVKDAKGGSTVQMVQRLKASTRKEGQSGNPALLAQAQAALKAIREMFGVDAAAKVEHSGTVSTNLVILPAKGDE